MRFKFTNEISMRVYPSGVKFKTTSLLSQLL